jgi:hypothetical protein
MDEARATSAASTSKWMTTSVSPLESVQLEAQNAPSKRAQHEAKVRIFE